MPERLLRTFIALSVPKQVATVQGMLQTTLEAKRKAVRWVKPNAIHLTLKFNGTTPPDIVPAMNDALKTAVQGIEPIDLNIRDTGCFPSVDRPRVLWLGIGGEVEKLKNLASRIHAAMAEHGYPDESENFHPHITMARIKYPQRQTPEIGGFLNVAYQAVPMHSDRIHLISSELLPTGPIYSNLGTHYFSPSSS